MNGLSFFIVSSKFRRLICTIDKESLPFAKMLTTLLERFGDVDSASSEQALILVSQINGLPNVLVNSDLAFTGTYNSFSGILSREAAQMALTCFLNNHYMWLEDRMGNETKELSDRHYELMNKAYSELSSENYAQFRNFLD